MCEHSILQFTSYSVKTYFIILAQIDIYGVTLKYMLCLDFGDIKKELLKSDQTHLLDFLDIDFG